MSTIVAPLPTGTGVTVIAEHRHRRDGESRDAADGNQHPAEHGEDAGSDRGRPHRDAPPPPEEEAIVPAETLFAAALLASGLPSRQPSPEELKLRQVQGWIPPESVLRLKDKLI